MYSSSWRYILGLMSLIFLSASNQESGCILDPAHQEDTELEDNIDGAQAMAPEFGTISDTSFCSKYCQKISECGHTELEAEAQTECENTCLVQREYLSESCLQAQEHWLSCLYDDCGHQPISADIITAPQRNPEQDCSAERDRFAVCAFELDADIDTLQQACCRETDLCGLANDGVCDCGGQASIAWDQADCQFSPQQQECCHPEDPCDFEDDRSCQCADQSWDQMDCAALP